MIFSKSFALFHQIICCELENGLKLVKNGHFSHKINFLRIAIIKFTLKYRFWAKIP